MLSVQDQKLGHDYPLLDRLRTTILRLKPAHNALFNAFMGYRTSGNSKTQSLVRPNKDKQVNKMVVFPLLS